MDKKAKKLGGMEKCGVWCERRVCRTLVCFLGSFVIQQSAVQLNKFMKKTRQFKNERISGEETCPPGVVPSEWYLSVVDFLRIVVDIFIVTQITSIGSVIIFKINPVEDERNRMFLALNKHLANANRVFLTPH